MLEKINKDVVLAQKFITQCYKLKENTTSISVDVGAFLALFFTSISLYNNLDFVYTITSTVMIFTSFVFLSAKYGFFDFYNKEDRDGFLERNIEEIFSEGNIYNKNNINEAFKTFDQISEHSKIYIGKNIVHKTVQDLKKKLIINSYILESNNKKDLLLLSKWINELEESSEEDYFIAEMIYILFEQYLNKINKEDFFITKDSLIDLIENSSIKEEKQHLLVNDIKYKVNDFNNIKEKKVDLQEEFLKLKLSKNSNLNIDKKQIIIKNI